MDRARKVPIRTCVACRVSSEKKTLTRVVRTPGEDVVVDLTGKMPGRGAYLCDAKECLAAALKANKLGRALKCEIPERLRSELASLVVKVDAGKELSYGGDKSMKAE